MQFSNDGVAVRDENAYAGAHFPQVGAQLVFQIPHPNCLDFSRSRYCSYWWLHCKHGCHFAAGRQALNSIDSAGFFQRTISSVDHWRGTGRTH